MKYFRHAGLALLLAAISATAWSHAVMKSASPAADATLAKAPPDVVLRFNEKLEADFSGIKLVAPSGVEIPVKSHLDAGNPQTLEAELPALSPGAYTVLWHAVGADGHLRKGEYRFTIR